MPLFKLPTKSSKLTNKISFVKQKNFLKLIGYRKKIVSILRHSLTNRRLTKNRFLRKLFFFQKFILLINKIFVTKIKQIFVKTFKIFTKLNKENYKNRYNFSKFGNFYIYFRKIIKPIFWLKSIYAQIYEFLSNPLKYKSHIVEYWERFLTIFLLYYFPFFTLLKQLIFSISVEEELVVNRGLLKFLGKISYFLPFLRKNFPFIDSDFSFWILYIYYFIFAASYKKLQIPYNIAYNGTLAFLFLAIQFVVEMLQEYSIVPFDFYLSIYQWLWEVQANFQLGYEFSSLYTKFYDKLLVGLSFLMIDKTQELKFMVFQFIIFPFIFVTLCGLIYNCVYYVFKKKNPTLPIITKTASRTLQDSEEPLF